MEKNTLIEHLDFIRDEHRDLSRIEYQNLKTKSELGTIPVEYLRQNLFNPTATDPFNSEHYKKTLFENEKCKVTINKYLHQRHKDILTVLFTDNLGVSEPAKDGSYYIYTNLTHIARALGYKNPNSSISRVKEYLNDLRQTDLVFVDKVIKKEDGHFLLGEYSLDLEKGYYKVKIPARTAKYHILNIAVEITKELNHEILKIPIKYARVKAVITYMLSHKPLRNGMMLETLMRQFEMEVNPKKLYAFKKELKENEETLNKFNIEFDETGKKLYLKDMLNFERAVTHKEIIESYAKEGRLGDLSSKKEKDTRESTFEQEIPIDITYLKLSYTNKYLRIKDKNYLIRDFSFKKNEADENISILIKTEINNREAVIDGKTLDFSELIKKLNGYNLEYLSFVNGITEAVEF